MTIETKRAPSPQELIQEWEEWKGLPKLPDIDLNEICKMDFKSEFQIILNEIESTQKKLTDDQYTKILYFQSRFVLFIFQYQIDIPDLTLRLHELYVLCIWKDDSQKIKKSLDSISGFFPIIDNLTSIQKERTTSNKSNQNKTTKKKSSSFDNAKNDQIINTDSKKSNNNNNSGNDINNSNDNNFDNSNSSNNNNSNNNNYINNNNKNNNSNINTNNISDNNNGSNSIITNNIKNNDIKHNSQKKTLPLNQNNKAYIKNQFTKNPFQSLSNSNDLYKDDNDDNNATNISISYADESIFNKRKPIQSNHIDNASPIKRELKDLLNLLKVKNGITDEKQTKKIFEKIESLYKHYNDDPRLRDECHYFEKRKMVPLQHLVSLSDYISLYVSAFK